MIRVLAALAVALLLPCAAAAQVQRLPAVLHVHSDLSTGDLPLDEVVRLAERQGLGAILLAENYLLRIEYGLPPFRALTRMVWQERGVLDTGIERYLARVAEARARHPNVVLLPGVEVMPHYYLSGSPFSLALTLHHTQKNILVFGIEDAAALASLPSVGNSRGGQWARQSTLDLIPATLVPIGLGLLLIRRRHRRRMGRTVVVVQRRPWLAAAIVVGIGALALARGWPFKVDRYPTWEDHGLAPHQTLIDHVERQGGVTMWSFPEAPDMGEHSFGPMRVSWQTDPHQDDLLKTFRYTAFGAVYEQPTRVAEPGGTWDRLLMQYAAGERSRPAWAVGESGFHGLVSGKRLGPVQTVFLVGEKSTAAVLDALRRGRHYALYRGPDTGLALNEFTVSAAGVEVIAGDTVRVAAGTPLEVRIGVDMLDGSTQPVRTTLVSNGRVAEAWAGRTPFRAVFRETFDGQPLVLRVEARGRVPNQLVTNPIFVQVP